MEKKNLPCLTGALKTLAEAADMTKISSWTLRRDIQMRKLACIRRGGRRGKILISNADLEAYLLRHRFSAIGE